MKEEYIIINKTAIQKRIEELKEYVGGRKPTSDEYAKMNIYNQVLSQSTPLIPEIQKAYTKAFSEGVVFGLHTEYKYQSSEEYIDNLKLDI